MSTEIWVNIVAWRHQAITWANVDLSSARLTDLHLRAIEENDITMPVPRVHLTSQINRGDVTMLSQKKTALGDNGEMSDRWLFLAEWCVQDRIEYKK